MLVSINQPAYLPWPGYFDRIAASDLHIVLDTVQFEKNSFVNRNRIKTPQGWTWLTVPVRTGGKFGALPIRDLAISETSRWPRQHFNALQANYGRAPFFEAHLDFFRSYYAAAANEAMFLPVAMQFIRHALQLLGIETRMTMSSDLEPTEAKSALVLELCRKVGATEYLSGPLGRDYLDLASFHAAGIAVRFHDYRPADYPQRWGGFEPGLSLIDMMMNVASEGLSDLVAQGRRLTEA